MGKGRVSQFEREERLSATEQAMIRLRSSFRVEQEMSSRFRVDARTVRKWITAVRAKWKEEAAKNPLNDRELLRVDMDKTLNEVLAAAMNRTVIVKDKDGNPVLDQNPNSPTYGKPLVKSNPDLQRVLHACIQLRALHSLDQPTRAHVTVAPDLNAMPELDKLPDEAVGKLKELLSSIAPDGDIRSLAGEWFRTHLPNEEGK